MDRLYRDNHPDYLAKLQNVSNEKQFVTDKMPQNFRYIGLLAAAFPEAKIIHVKRNPAAVCWANYKQYFVSKNIGYSYAIDDVISYHKLYEDLMDFWTNTLPDRIYKLDYEQLTVNQESKTRQLIEYLGLEWDKNCLSPQNNTRIVATASNLQVRQKVYRGSSEEWKKYQPFLNKKFDDFIQHKNLGLIEQAHESRGLPKTNFQESYKRFSKALIGIGKGQGRDRSFDLETEFIVLNNPYTDCLLYTSPSPRDGLLSRMPSSA